MNNELYHYGVLGMRWGVRRYQNRDGTLTSAGKKKYGAYPDGKPKKVSRKVRKQRAAALEKARQAKLEKKTLEEKKKELLKSTDAKELYKNKDLLTTAEINERLSRIDTERRLASVAKSTEKTGMDKVNKILEIGRKVNEVYEFTNTPVMKVIKKELGLEEKEKRMSLRDVYNNRDKLSDKKLTEALKRANTEKAMKKILDEEESANKQSATSKSEKTETYSGTVEGEGTSSEKSSSENRKNTNKDIFDSEWREVSSDTVSRGEVYVSGLLKDKRKK